jgi:hypothetical protein
MQAKYNDACKQRTHRRTADPRIVQRRELPLSHHPFPELAIYRRYAKWDKNIPDDFLLIPWR